MKIKIPNKHLVGRDFNGNIKDFSFDAESIKEIFCVFPDVTAVKYEYVNENKICSDIVFLELSMVDTIGVLRNLIHNEMAKIAPPCFK